MPTRVEASGLLAPAPTGSVRETLTTPLNLLLLGMMSTINLSLVLYM